MSTELHGLSRVIAAIKRGLPAQAKTLAPTPKPTSKTAALATPLERTEFQFQLERVQRTCASADRPSVEKIWRDAFASEPTRTLAQMRGIRDHKAR